MCYSEGTLQAFVDGEVQGIERRRIEEHLRVCGDCRETVARLAGEQALLERTVGAYLEAPNGELVDARAGWNRLQSRLRPVSKESWFQMIRRHRQAVVGMAAVLTLAIGLSFGSVRAAAGRFLSVFRVSGFQTISVTPADLARIEAAIREGSGSVRLGDVGEFAFESSGAEGLVSLDQAKAAVDFGLRLPASVPGGLQLQGLTATPKGELTVTVDVEKANQLLRSLGSTKMLPDELDGQSITVRMPASIDAQYGGASVVHVLQARSPELDVPGNAGADAVRDAVLAMPFIPENVKRQVASIDDWQHTFLVPNVQGSTLEVTVDGVAGVYLTAPAEYKGKVPGVNNALVWEKNDVVYAVIGEFSLEQGLAIGNSMR